MEIFWTMMFVWCTALFGVLLGYVTTRLWDDDRVFGIVMALYIAVVVTLGLSL